MNKSKTALFTADKDLAVSFLQEINKSSKLQLLHLPLENYTCSADPEESKNISGRLNSFSFIIHGNLRNARYFLQWASKKSILHQVRDTVNVLYNQATVDLLEEYSIPGVMPGGDARPIDIIEFMLRISREGTVLYPTTDQKDEEIPGLLKELEMPVVEFQVCKEERLKPETMNVYRKKVHKPELDSVIFHNRSSVTRILNGFPDLDFNSLECISSGQAVSQKLLESNITPAREARGSWHSLLDLLID